MDDKKIADDRDKEIRDLCSLIQSVWQAHPTLRLGQLITNAIEVGDGVFYIEDKNLRHQLMEYWKKTVGEI